MKIGKVVILEPNESFEAVSKDDVRTAELVIQLMPSNIDNYDMTRVKVIKSRYTREGEYVLDRRKALGR